MKLTYAERDTILAALGRWQSFPAASPLRARAFLPDGKGVIVEGFELLVLVATSGELIEQLDAWFACVAVRDRTPLESPQSAAAVLRHGECLKNLIRVYRKPGRRLMNRATWPFAELRACVKTKSRHAVKRDG